MPNAQAGLPSYADPPVTEVVVGVSVAELSALTVPHLGLLWSTKFRSSFPKIEEHPPYDPPVERFDSPLQGPDPSFRFTGVPPLPRLWLLSEDDQELLQVQKNWFACNWRKVKPDAVYGRWPSRREAFQKWLSALQDYVVENKLGELKPLQCEVTYINHVAPAAGWSRHGELPKILKVAADLDGGFLPEPEQMQVAAQYVIPDNEGRPVGRLHISSQPAFRREDNTPIFVLNLTVRSKPEGEGLEGVLRSLDRGREWIVRGFAQITSPAMQDVWGRHD
jgi:uncharacterized protein (TIGR04255 family)